LQKAGYQIERNEKHFEVKDFERSTIEKFSNRTRQIEAKAQELGLSYADDKGKLGAMTRANKRTGHDKKDIRLQWRSRLSEKELELINSAKSEPPPSGGGSGAIENKKDRITAKEVLDYSLDHALERKSVVEEKELLTTWLKKRNWVNYS
jgi:hypothetical protein